MNILFRFITQIKNLTSPGWVTQLLGASFHTPKIAVMIPSYITNLGCEFDPHSGHMWEATD